MEGRTDRRTYVGTLSVREELSKSLHDVPVHITYFRDGIWLICVLFFLLHDIDCLQGLGRIPEQSVLETSLGVHQ